MKFNEDKDSEREKDTIDYLKAIAAFFVVLGHGIILYQREGGGQGGLIKVIYIIITSIHVPIFFMIAGYLNHEQELKNYYIKKLKRLLVPYVTFAAFKLLYSNLISKKFAHADSVGVQIFDAVFVGDLYWFVYTMLIVYFIVPFIWKKDNSKLDYFFKWVTVCFGLILINLIIDSVENTINIYMNYFQILKVIYYLPFFIIGYSVRQYRMEILCFIKDKKIFSWGCCFAIVIIIYGTIIKYFNRDMNYVGQFFYSEALIIVIVSGVCGIRKKLKILKIISRYSLQIMFFDSFFKIVLFKLISHTALQSVWMILLAAAINVGLTCVISGILERVPYICFLFGLQYRKNRVL